MYPWREAQQVEDEACPGRGSASAVDYTWTVEDDDPLPPFFMIASSYGRKFWMMDDSLEQDAIMSKYRSLSRTRPDGWSCLYAQHPAPSPILL